MSTLLKTARALLSDSRGSAAEFALILPLAVLFLVGLIDAGRYAYTFNQGEKATQIGARWTVVTNPITPELATQSYTSVGGVTLTQGDRIPAAALGLITCTNLACVCTTPPCTDNAPTLSTPAFNALVNRMTEIMPSITPANLVVEYRGSGLGYAGNPDGMDIAPLVTVRLVDMDFTAIILLANTVGLPDFSYTLTMEDGIGDGSN
ncbi:TadE/TadG family type IV pilus assembly protein [Altererythrobacter aquiaggeris]|uniref:TadE/TadG family type IV pilus assembly protein n=1 Tax=Aestuarierythrobacter aquiaggeris TaxID=1898396 RepID=UPI003015E8AF